MRESFSESTRDTGALKQTAADYEQKLCTAMTMIAKEKVDAAGYDKTIQGQVVSCLDPVIGKYKIKYQDSLLQATYSNLEDTLSEGAEVYITIPNNDLKKEKIITGTVANLGTNYIQQVQDKDRFIANGINGIAKNDTIFTLNSYKTEIKTLYSIDENINLLTVNDQELKTYLLESPYFSCGATFSTKIPIEQQIARGNYGLIVRLDFNNPATNKIQTKSYVLDTNSMIGTPFNFVNPSVQHKFFEIDSINFEKVHSIQIFVKDFPNQDNKKADDIFISNLDICGAIKLSEKELKDGVLTFNTPDGKIFLSDTKELTIQAQLRIKGKIANPNIQNIPFYWFRENLAVTSAHKNYSSYGGEGWECLNTEILKSEDGKDRIWKPHNDTYIIQSNTMMCSSRRYKCVAVYNEQIYTNIILIQNNNAQYKVTLQGIDPNHIFYNNQGKQSLTCVVEDLNTHYEIGSTHCLFRWAVENMYEQTSYLPLDIKDNQKKYSQYIAAQQDYNNFRDKIASGDIPNTPSNKAKEREYYNKLHEFDNVEMLSLEMKNNKLEQEFSNTLYNINIGSISTFAIYKCCVFDLGNNYLGSATYKIINNIDTTPKYTLVLHDGDKVFHYDEYGHKPPSILTPISFSIYDEKGRALDQEVLEACKITWTIPLKNSLLTADDTKKIDVETTPDLNYKKYKNTVLFRYNVNDTFNEKKGNNDIELEVIYDGITLHARTNFSFVKQGEIGTNGTQYYCKLVPNSNDIPEYPILTLMSKNKENVEEEYELDSSEWNFKIKEEKNNATLASSKLFNLKIYQGDKEIFNNIPLTDLAETANIDNDTIQLSKVKINMLSNVYATTSNGVIQDASDLTFDQKNDKILMNEKVDVFHNHCPANILQCQCTLTDLSTNLSYTLTTVLPIVVVKLYPFKENYKDFRIRIANNTGFTSIQYSNDGINPKYNANSPFSLEVLQKVAGTNEYKNINYNSSYTYKSEKDIPDNLASIFTWSVYGSYYDHNLKQFKNSSNLIPQGHRNYSYCGSVLTSEDLPKTANAKDAYFVTEQQQLYIWKIGTNSTGWVPSTEAMLNTYKVKPSSQYDGISVNNGICCIVADKQQEIGVIQIPIHFFLNIYGLAHLNGWNGNSVEVNNEGGYILTPQVGAGEKTEENGFTGVFMGKVQYPQNENMDIGLIGMANGKQTFKIDAKTGGAILGKRDSGRIIIDPGEMSTQKQTHACIYSDSYWEKYDETGFPRSYDESNVNRFRSQESEESYTDYVKARNNHHGMCIDFETPKIDFANENFSVTPGGFLTAKGGGSIAGWNILDSTLYSENKQVGLNAYCPKDINTKDAIQSGSLTVKYPVAGQESSVELKSAAFWANKRGIKPINAEYVEGSYAEPDFFVSHDGYFRASAGVIGTTLSNSIFIGGPKEQSAIYTKNKSSFNIDNDKSGFYLGTDGIQLGGSFYVTSTGNLTAKSGHISTWQIGKDNLHDDENIIGMSTGSGFYAGKEIEMEEEDGTIVKTRPFFVTTAGRLTCSNIYITGGSLILKDGEDTIFSIDKENGMIANKGTVGGWVIDTTTLRSLDKKVVLDSATGTISGALIKGSTVEGGTISGGTISGTAIDGGTITIGKNFSVDEDGIVTCKNIKITDGTMDFTEKDSTTGAPKPEGGSTGIHNGIFSAKGAEISGTIFAEKGKIGDWYIDQGIRDGEDDQKSNVILLPKELKVKLDPKHPTVFYDISWVDLASCVYTSTNFGTSDTYDIEVAGAGKKLYFTFVNGILTSVLDH